MCCVGALTPPSLVHVPARSFFEKSARNDLICAVIYATAIGAGPRVYAIRVGSIRQRDQLVPPCAEMVSLRAAMDHACRLDATVRKGASDQSNGQGNPDAMTMGPGGHTGRSAVEAFRSRCLQPATPRATRPCACPDRCARAAPDRLGCRSPRWRESDQS
jgi:hypothetical protein